MWEYTNQIRDGAQMFLQCHFFLPCTSLLSKGMVPFLDAVSDKERLNLS